MEFKNPDISITEKVKYIETKLLNNDEEVLDAVIGEYEFCNSSTLLEVLEELSISSTLNSQQKYRIFETMYYSQNEYSTTSSKLEKLIASYIPDNPVFEFTTVKWLFSFGNGAKHISRLYKYLGNSNLKDITRYNQVFSLREIYPNETMNGISFLFGHSSCGSRCKIMCCQYLLENMKRESSESSESSEIKWNEMLQTLFSIAEDEKEEYNIRADAADTIHHYFTDENQEKALSILRKLGGSSNNIYEDKQNIHTVDISEGLILIGEIVPTVKYNEIAKILSRDKDPKISASLGRIVMDSARYGNKNTSFTSEEIMERIWTFILSNENKDTLIARLLEELRDMADTCSSGHALRLINVLSGFGADVRISFIDQIASSFEGRMNALIKKIENEDIKSNILLDMVDKGPLFMEFFNKNQKIIIDQLYNEYVEGGYICKDEFDMGIMKALTLYEGRANYKKVEFKMV